MCLETHVFEISLCWNFNEFNCRMIKSTHYLLTAEFLTMHNILFQQKLNFYSSFISVLLNILPAINQVTTLHPSFRF